MPGLEEVSQLVRSHVGEPTTGGERGDTCPDIRARIKAKVRLRLRTLGIGLRWGSLEVSVAIP